MRLLAALVAPLLVLPTPALAAPMHADLGVGRLDATLVTHASDDRYPGLAQGRSGAAGLVLVGAFAMGVQVRPALALLLRGTVSYSPNWDPPQTAVTSLLTGSVGPELDLTPDPAIPFHVRAGLALAMGRLGLESPVLPANHLGTEAWLGISRERSLGARRVGVSFAVHGTWLRGGSGGLSSSVNAFTPVVSLTMSDR